MCFTFKPRVKSFYKQKQADVYVIAAGRLVSKAATVESGWTRTHLQLLSTGWARPWAPRPARHAPSQHRSCGRQLSGGRLSVGARRVSGLGKNLLLWSILCSIINAPPVVDTQVHASPCCFVCSRSCCCLAASRPA